MSIQTRRFPQISKYWKKEKRDKGNFLPKAVKLLTILKREWYHTNCKETRKALPYNWKYAFYCDAWQGLALGAKVCRAVNKGMGERPNGRAAVQCCVHSRWRKSVIGSGELRRQRVNSAGKCLRTAPVRRPTRKRNCTEDRTEIDVRELRPHRYGLNGLCRCGFILISKKPYASNRS